MGTVKKSYPHDVAAVFAKLADAEFMRRRDELAGYRNIDVRVEEQGDVTEVRVERDIETDIPSFAKKVVNPVNHVVDVIRWRADGDGHKATYESTVSSRIRVRGEITLRPSGGGCDFVDSFTATVDVPLVGRKIAGVVEKETEKAIRINCERLLDALGS